MNLEQLIYDFAQGLVEADSMSPIAVNQKSGKSCSGWIGPHTNFGEIFCDVKE